MAETSAGAEYVVVVEREDVAAAEGSFRRILQGRGQSFSRWMSGLPVVGTRNAFRLLQVLTPLAWFLGVLVTYLKIESGAPLDEVVPWGLLTLLFGLVAAVFLLAGFDLMDRLLGGLTDRLWARAARKTIAMTLPVAPFRVMYTVEEDAWRTVVDEPPLERLLRRGEAHEVVSDGIVCLVFRREHAQRYSAVVWAKTPEIRAALEAFVRGD